MYVIYYFVDFDRVSPQIHAFTVVKCNIVHDLRSENCQSRNTLVVSIYADLRSPKNKSCLGPGPTSNRSAGTRTDPTPPKVLRRDPAQDARLHPAQVPQPQDQELRLQRRPTRPDHHRTRREETLHAPARDLPAARCSSVWCNTWWLPRRSTPRCWRSSPASASATAPR